MERLQHLFEGSVKLVDLPKEFKIAQFETPGGKVQINTIEWINAKEGEIVVKVASCGLNETDLIVKYGLLPHFKYPMAPGSSVTGEVVQVGPGAKHFKVGQKVCGVAAHGALGEYAVVNANYAVELKDKGLSASQAYVEVFEGARIDAELRRFDHETLHLARDEVHRRRDANSRLGFTGEEGAVIVYGSGAAARVAIQVLHSKNHRAVLVVPDSNTRWTPSFYDVNDSDMHMADSEIASALKFTGGIRLVLAVSQPDVGFTHLLDAMRYGGEIVVFGPHREKQLQVPLAHVIGKALVIRGAQWPDHKSLEEVLALVDKHLLHVSLNRYGFNEDEIATAFNDLENKTKFDQPIIVVSKEPQAKVA
ncbi:hypothetical protein JCM10212_005139 [Sporobolomyces blumeae]